jgi:pre-mRNA cleavage complex 2 protein Pcf11
MDATIAQFHGLLLECLTVEKRAIVALTEYARDAARAHPAAAPALAHIVASRALHAPADVKLPALYLLDSLAKTVGEPFLTPFAAALPEVYAAAWAAGAPGLHRPLERLMATWGGVFPAAALDAARARAAAAPPP